MFLLLASLAQASTFTNNYRDGNGGGLCLDSQSDVSITGAHFQGNTATGSGGGMYISEGNLALSDSSFEGNEAAS
ncbi:MAG: hypothetical protein ACI9VR_000227 [Cognaticolwellia sp.]